MSNNKGDAVKNLLAKIPTAPSTKPAPVIQEVTKEKGKAGRKMHRKEGVVYVRLSPAIPEDLKQEMDVAIKSTLRSRYPTIDTFVEAAIREMLKRA